MISTNFRISGQRHLRSLGLGPISRILMLPFASRGPSSSSKQSINESELIPEVTAGWLSLLTFQWVTPLLSLGYARPLEAPDLYKLPPHRSAAHIADLINESMNRQKENADAYNQRLANGEIQPCPGRVLIWMLKGKRAEKETRWRQVDGRKKAHLVWALNDSVKWWFWTGGILKVASDTALVSSPLLVKAIIDFSASSYAAHRLGHQAPSVGTGVGYVLGLFALQIFASLANNHFLYRSASTGVLLRGGLITAIYTRSLKLTWRARFSLTNGKLVNHISTDVSRIDFGASYFHMAWAAPIQMAICLVLLLLNLGPAALTGFAFFIIMSPLQSRIMKLYFKFRQKSMQWTDKRAALLQELLGKMKVIKFFAWEKPFLARILQYRKMELSYVRLLPLIRAANNATAMSLPILASVVAFVTYSATGHRLDPAAIFSSLTLFALLRLPLLYLPLSFSAITDAANAVNRLKDVFEAELLQDTHIHTQNDDLGVALLVQDASFTWESLPSRSSSARKAEAQDVKSEPNGGNDDSTQAPAVKGSGENVFELRGIKMSIPRGQLVAIVGPVGSGKTSLLQGILGEMKQTAGAVTFAGGVAYCPQVAWIQNATIRENICFGRAFEEERYCKAVRDSCLGPDLAMLPNGDLTEVGERGISLSGGQKQRINICRAIYRDTEIQIFDDPLSALDAHVGKAVFQNVLLNSGKTRILITHALHFLPQVDYVFNLVDGRITEHGTFDDLMRHNGEFAKLVTEFGAKHEEEEESKFEDAIERAEIGCKGDGDVLRGATTQHQQVRPGIMQVEERNKGAISWTVYKEYMGAANGIVVLPLLFFSLVLMQGATIMASYWLVYWQELKWDRTQGFYMGMYALLGVTQAIASFVMGSIFALLAYFTSQKLYKVAIERVMRAPMSFFETTPLGRITNRFSKDIDTIDNYLGDSLRLLISTLSSIIGAIILISIVLPWFLIGVFCIMIIYASAAMFYRASARELKRLDAILRSSVYSHFSESLSGLATIRAYGETERFRSDNEMHIDVENRAYWLSVTNQRWLGIRLDFLGALLMLIVSMLTIGMRFTISPSQTGLVLAYVLNIQQVFGMLVRQSAEVENNMTSVERLVHYMRRIEQEAPHELPGSKLASYWPTQGRIEFRDVVMSYRPELPHVLKGISMTVQPGESIGIIGRTGAGKSSIITALYRLVELTSGSIFIDGVNISEVGLADLRNGLAVIPQDPLLFSGTLRSNLDPFGFHDDARLWDAMKRACLIENAPKPEGASLDDEILDRNTYTRPSRLTLDTMIEDEGGNLSIGQRSLVSLARALVGKTKIIILDEATASVDYETDRKIQDTITSEFKDRTILCIAHRLRTIIGYDRICVLDAGEIAEFDTPIHLYSNPHGIFRRMCEDSAITLDDLKIAVSLWKKNDVRA